MNIHSETFSKNVGTNWVYFYESQTEINKVPCVLQKWRQDDMEVSSVYFKADDVRDLGEGKLKSLVRRNLIAGRSGVMLVSTKKGYVFVDCDVTINES
jgi:hypothetical protein